MKLQMNKWWIVALVAMILCSVAGVQAQSSAPVIFFTDVTSGPNNGGQNGNGTILSIYGKQFGVTQGGSTVTVGGAAVASYLTWGTLIPGGTGVQKISVAIGANAKTGAVVVHTAQGDSNANITFTVRSGNIYCVSNTGSDATGHGTFPAGCFKTMPYAVHNAMAAGDITYVMDGVVAKTQDPFRTYSAPLSIVESGTQTNPMALIVYPGATVTVDGSGSGLSLGIRTPNVSPCTSTGCSWWVVAGFNIIASQCMNLNSPNWRVIANDMTAPMGGNLSACVEVMDVPFVDMFGNHFHNIGNSSTSKTYHAVYYSSGSNASHENFAWNSIHDVLGCRGFQIHVDGGATMTDIHVHDNLIYNIRCDGINFSTVNPDGGTVEAYNNIIYHAGMGPDPTDGSSSYACIRIAGSASTGKVQIYNNTMYDCGSGGTDSSTAAGIEAGIKTNVTNNIIYELTRGTIFATTDGCGSVSGQDNDSFGVSNACAANMTGNMSSNPMFSNPAIGDFHLLSGSPMVGGGIAVSGLFMDYDANPRPSTGAIDVGAFEFASVTRPNPPTNVTAVAH
jgi:hypothetical protein